MLGKRATDRQLADTPSRIAPTFLREVNRAQRRLGPFQFPESGVVFYTPEDAVVGVDAIRERVPNSNRVVYRRFEASASGRDPEAVHECGHQLFDSPSREVHIETILDALEGGPAALD